MTHSICHTTARPKGWQESHKAWIAAHTGKGIAGAGWSDLEYILCMDRRWGFTLKDATAARKLDIKVVWNTGRKCMVDGYSYAAAASTGAVLILNSDDMFPCDRWDEALFDPYCSAGKRLDYVFQVSSDTHADERGLMVLQILSRGRYERLGYALYPEYESMYADDDFSEHARQDGAVIGARHLVFPHRHRGVESDEVYRHQNRPESYALGEKILARRRAEGFRG
jgi:hypothetical protein